MTEKRNFRALTSFALQLRLESFDDAFEGLALRAQHRHQLRVLRGHARLLTLRGDPRRSLPLQLGAQTAHLGLQVFCSTRAAPRRLLRLAQQLQLGLGARQFALVSSKHRHLCSAFIQALLELNDLLLEPLVRCLHSAHRARLRTQNFELQAGLAAPEVALQEDDATQDHAEGTPGQPAPNCALNSHAGRGESGLATTRQQQMPAPPRLNKQHG